MIKNKCIVDGCDKVARARGLCPPHYYKFAHEDIRPRHCPDTIRIADIPRSQQSYTINYDNIWLEKKLQRVLHTLTEREYLVISFRYGLNGECEHTLEECGQEFEVTRERIRQIEAKALRKLRHPERAKYLKPFMSGEETHPQPHIQYAGNEGDTDGSYYPTCRVNQGSKDALESGQR